MHPRIFAAVFFAAALAGPPVASAQEPWPSRPVSIVVPFGAGSQPDVLVRSMTEGLTKAIGQPVVIVNREGAAGTIAVESVARAKPDGYTLGFGPPGQFTIQTNVRRDLGYSIDSFEFLCQTHVTTFVLATGPDSPYRTLAQVIDAARAAPGKINFGSAGHLLAPHLITESIAAEAGVRLTHVPFKSVADLYAQTLNGTLDFAASTPIALGSGRGMRGLVVVGESRLPAHPDIPLLQELGFKRASFPGLTVLGFYAPRGLAPQPLRMLAEACPRLVEAPSVKAVADKVSTPVRHADGAAYAAGLREDHRRIAELIATLGVKPQ